MAPFLFIIYCLITFLVLAAGALYWYFTNIDLNHEDLYEKAMVALQKNDLEKAKELFLISLEDNPKFKEAKYKLGMTFVKMKDYDSAKKCFKEILETEPDDFHAQYNLGLIDFKAKDYDSAKSWFNRILDTEPRDFNTLFNLALTHQMQKSYEDAREFYEKALQENAKDADSYFNLGLIAFEHNEYEEALSFFEKANNISFGRTDIMFSILRCQDEMCQYETEEIGQTMVNQYVKLSAYPDLPLEFDVFLARVYAKTGKIDKALEIINRALLSSPDDALVYRILGLIKLVKNELKDAKKALLKSIGLDKENPEGYNILSYVFLQQDNNVEYITYKTKYKELIAEKIEKAENAEKIKSALSAL
ncbi:MAG: tetratricopeptide repeat protein [bacterium]